MTTADTHPVVQIRRGLASYREELAGLLPLLEKEEEALRAALPALEAAAEEAERTEASTRARYFGVTTPAVSEAQQKRREKALADAGLGRDNLTSPLNWKFPRPEGGPVPYPGSPADPLTGYGTAFFDLIPQHQAELDEAAQATVQTRAALREAPARRNRLRARIEQLRSQAEAAEDQLARLVPQRPAAADTGLLEKMRQVLARADGQPSAPEPVEPPKGPKRR